MSVPLLPQASQPTHWAPWMAAVAATVAAAGLVLVTSQPSASLYSILPATATRAVQAIPLPGLQRSVTGAAESSLPSATVLSGSDPVVRSPSGSSAPLPSPAALLGAAAALIGAALAILNAKTPARPVPFVAMAATTGKKKPVVRKGKYSGYESFLRQLTPIEFESVGAALQDGYTLLDVRPRYEWERIRPENNSVHIQYIKENETSPLDLMSFGRKWASTTYAGYTRDLIRNPDFVAEVTKAFPKDAKLIVCCHEGLRSLIATKELQDAGFTNVRWLKDGMQMLESEPFFASIGSDPSLGYADACYDGGIVSVRLFRAIGQIGRS